MVCSRYESHGGSVRGRKPVVEGNVDNRFSASAAWLVNTVRGMIPPIGRRARVAERVAFGEVTEPPQNQVAFLLTARPEIVAAGDRRNSTNHPRLRLPHRLAALSVCNVSSDSPNATPTVALAPPRETLKLSASLG